MEKKLSFIIPCYRSENTIAEVVTGLVREYTESGYDFEIILVNDSSPDNTYGVIRQLCADDQRVRGINLSRNFGQHSALMAGMRYAQGEILVLLDDDGQTPPDQAKKLIDQVEAGHDAAIARYGHKKHSAVRNMGSKINESMARWLIGKPKGLYLSSYVAMKRFVADEILTYTLPYPYMSGMILRATSDIVNVDVEHKERTVGESGYTFSKLISLWFNGFTNFSIKPLRIAIVLGIIIAILGFGVGIYSIVMKLLNDTPLGWASTMSAIAFIGGIILVVLGLIGEYVGRMFMGLNHHPQFVIKEKLNMEDTTDCEK